MRPYNPVLNVNLFDHLSGVDYGDLPVTPGYLPESHAQITEGAREIVVGSCVPFFSGR